jgi:hypothetical protein
MFQREKILQSRRMARCHHISTVTACQQYELIPIFDHKSWVLAWVVQTTSADPL